MTLTRAEVEGLVVRIQGEFLSTPALRLSPGQAAKHFDINAGICESVMSALADARVLAVTTGGGYERFFPRTGAPARGARFQAA